MKSNHQARHLLGLNYKLSRQKKVVLEGDEETTINHIRCYRPQTPRWLIFSLSDDNNTVLLPGWCFFMAIDCLFTRLKTFCSILCPLLSTRPSLIAAPGLWS